MMYTWSRPFQTHSTFPAYETSFNRINSRCVDEMCTVRSNYSHSFLMTEFFIHSQTFIAGTKWKIRCRSSACICHLNTNRNRKFIFKLELKFKNLIKKRNHMNTHSSYDSVMCALCVAVSVHLCNIVFFFMSNYTCTIKFQHNWRELSFVLGILTSVKRVF